MSRSEGRVLRNILDKKRMIVIMPAVLIVCLVIIAFLIFIKPLLFAVKMAYTIKPGPVESKLVMVNIRIDRNRWVGPKDFQLGKGVFRPLDVKCMDDSGKNVLFSDKDDTLVIGPINHDAQYIDFSYSVKIGDADGVGYQGAFYDNMIAFSGDRALYFPYFKYEDGSFAGIAKNIRQITIKVDAQDGLNTVIPYQTRQNIKQTEPVEISHPDWKTIYNLGKSCYAIGKFEEVHIKGANDDISILLDPVYKSKLTSKTEKVISSLYDYYTGIFGSKLDNCPIILLRNDSSGKGMIVGGVGGKSLGISLDISRDSDLKTFSHSLYSTFFDNKINPANLHYAPNLWLYKGLAAYYENLSMDALPDEIKSQSRINSSDRFKELYSKYLYFRLKEPAVYKISPAQEASAMQGQLQFFFYTEAPLIIKMVEGMAYMDNHRPDVLLSYLLKHSDDKTINMGKFMYESIGQNEETIRSYLSGDKVFPYPGRLTGDKEEPDKVTRQLDEYEQLLCSWIKADMPQYPYDKIYLLEPDKLSDEIIKRDIRFASDDIERMVGDFSPAILMLLKEYKLRADVCGEKDINDPMLKLKLLNDASNVQKWYNYLEKLGVDIGNEKGAGSN